MQHKYKLYDVDKDGNCFDTGKIIIAEPPAYDGPYKLNDGTIKAEIMKIFGFTQYINYYYISKISNKEYHISYNYGEGMKPVWVLKQGL